MKTKVTAAMIASIVLAVSFCAADSPTNASGSDSMARLREELQQTQALVKQLTTRTARLEQRVRALEESNAELRKELRRFQRPNQPRWSYPATNGVPPLTPLQSR